jgi:hypothetical protein
MMNRTDNNSKEESAVVVRIGVLILPMEDVSAAVLLELDSLLKASIEGAIGCTNLKVVMLRQLEGTFTLKGQRCYHTRVQPEYECSCVRREGCYCAVHFQF